MQMRFFSDGWNVYSTEAFLFSLKNRDNQPYKMTVYRNSWYAMYCVSYYGPTFGSGYDLRIYDNCNRNTYSSSKLGGTYKLPPGYTYGTTQAKSLLAGSYNFKVDEYEVFFQPGKLASNNRTINTYILPFSVCLGFCILNRWSSDPYVLPFFDEICKVPFRLFIIFLVL